jgi:hypothetical protein
MSEQPHHHELSGHELGQLAARFEAGGRLDAVSHGRDATGRADPGGISYGPYQMTSQTVVRREGGGREIKHDGGTVQRFLHSDEGKPWAHEFANQKPGDEGFGDTWKQIAKRDKDDFRAANDEFIKRTHNDPFVQRFQEVTGVDLRDRSPALQQAAFSTSVQHGGSDRRFAHAVEHKASELGVAADKLTDRQICDAIYDERERAAGKGVVGNRYEREREQAHDLIERDRFRSPAAERALESGVESVAGVAAETLVRETLTGRQEERTGERGRPDEREERSVADWPNLGRA